MNESAPIDQVIRQNRQSAIAIAQQVLPIVLQQEMSMLNHEQLTADPLISEKADDAQLPPAHEVVAYALELGREFIRQADAYLNAPIPGMTGTA